MSVRRVAWLHDGPGAGPGRRWHLGALALALAGAALACTRARDPASWDEQQCSCTYITDLDAPGHVDVRVCAQLADRDAVAQSCASASGVGAVSGCTCQPTGTKCGARPPCSF